MPQFDDLRGNATALQNIKPQTADQYEIGLKTSKLYDLYLTGFYNRFHNLVFQDIRVINGVEQNVVLFGGSRAYGVEFEGALRPIAGLQLSTRGVWQNGKFLDFGTNSGHQVNRQPQFQIAFSPSYTQRTAWGKARVFGTFTHIGNRFADLEKAAAGQLQHAGSGRLAGCKRPLLDPGDGGECHQHAGADRGQCAHRGVGQHQWLLPGPPDLRAPWNDHRRLQVLIV
jgi:hypothetical protein